MPIGTDEVAASSMEYLEHRTGSLDNPLQIEAPADGDVPILEHDKTPKVKMDKVGGQPLANNASISSFERLHPADM